ncbi:TPA: plasmid related protein [Salmonella enterica]|nr:plasmid related protein [Salmonella enterica]
MAILFPYGKLCITTGIADLVSQGHNLSAYLKRHLSADWGDLDEADKRLNDNALKNNNDRIFSAYKINPDLKIWIITEYDRSVTTILLPAEY